jgi:FxLD family lantipeptide
VTAQLHESARPQLDDWDLDVTIIESGPEADRLIRMTDDGCGSTCASACAGSC